MTLKNIEKIFLDSIELKKEIVEGDYLKILCSMGDEIVTAIKGGKKLMLCGNGGSAADAQHLAAEMLIRLRPTYNRDGIPAIALTQDTSTITACGNDLGYEYIYERLVKTLGNSGDVLIGITTSGNSENVIRAMIAAKLNGIKIYGFLGSDGGKSLELCDKAFLVPGNNTGRIQEAHITAGHALMEYIEDGLLKENYISLQD